MKSKPILIVNGEPNSIFIEILFKSIKYKKYKSPIVLISSYKILDFYVKKFNFKKKINIINYKLIKNENLKKGTINLINIDLDFDKNYKKITNKSNNFIKKSFDIALQLIKIGFTNKFINGPISKKNFLNKKFPGITEYISFKSNTKKYAMLIFNKQLSVCPLTTHIPLKNVYKYINKKIFQKK